MNGPKPNPKREPYILCGHCRKAIPTRLYARHIQLSPRCYFRSNMQIPAGISRDCMFFCPFCSKEMQANELPGHLVVSHRNNVPQKILQTLTPAAPARSLISDAAARQVTPK